jgi:hypothetical protein
MDEAFEHSLRFYAAAADLATTAAGHAKSVYESKVFPILVSQENLLPIAQETLRSITHSPRSKQARGLLTSLALLDGEEINPTGSKYAQALLALLRQKPLGQVVNREEIFATVAGDVIFFAPHRYRLEPELVMILIVALVASGEVLLVTNQQVFDTNNVTELANLPLKELLHFKQLERPKSFHLPSSKHYLNCLPYPPI